MVKIAFFDIDGTVLKMGEKQPSEKTLYALKQLHNSGVILCMATGRSCSCVPHFEGIDFDVYLTFNGSYVRNSEGVIYRNPLDEKDRDTVISNLKAMNRAIAVSNENLIVTNGTDPDLQQYFAFGNVEMIISEDFDEIVRGDIYQIMCSCRKEEYGTILNGCENTAITAWWDRAADIIPAQSGKGNAVREVLKYYGLTKEDAIAFGDGRNDMEMLEAVGTGVAMGNASEEVKAIADDVCADVKDDGIYHYCLSRQLIEEM